MHFHHTAEKDRNYGYRAWLHVKQTRHGKAWADACYKIEAWALTGSFRLGLDFDDEDTTLSICLGLFSLYLSAPWFRRFYPKERREVAISFYESTLSWHFWTDPHSWSSTIPKWQYGHLDFKDLVLGRHVCSHSVVEERDVLVPMPEKAYPAKARLEDWVWRRPRWFPLKLKRVQIEIPGGIPFPGKGENSWDCGDDATHSICTNANTIADGVGKLVASVLKDRVRNGGWSDYNWKRGADDVQA